MRYDIYIYVVRRLNNYRPMKSHTRFFFLNSVTWGTHVGHVYMFAFLYIFFVHINNNKNIYLFSQ